jgi:MoxR-like ATPase
MDYPYFHKDLMRSAAPRRAEHIPTLDRARLDDPGTYIPSAELVEAVNVALVLGMPLLLTGEPGTGKTQLAAALGAAFSCPVHKFETKSTSTARDLFYSFDALSAFKADKGIDQRQFVRFQALGRAILDAFPAEEVASLLPLPGTSDYVHAGPRRSVVLIDEIDKAPRDFPNDVLNEIERFYFRVPELQNTATPGADGNGNGVARTYRPIVVLTSNSEKGLPDPFLRRCVYFDIQFPDEAQMGEIVAAHLTELRSDSPLLVEALDLFYALRKDSRRTNLHKQPSTAELLNWLQILAHRGLGAESRLTEQKALVLATLTTLVKNADDRKEAIEYIKSGWGVPG